MSNHPRPLHPGLPHRPTNPADATGTSQMGGDIDGRRLPVGRRDGNDVAAFCFCNLFATGKIRVWESRCGNLNK
jgi:hypothetical protein